MPRYQVTLTTEADQLLKELMEKRGFTTLTQLVCFILRTSPPSTKQERLALARQIKRETALMKKSLYKSTAIQSADTATPPADLSAEDRECLI